MVGRQRHSELNHPWLVAAWPGMGGVSVMAAASLVECLGAEPVASIPEREFFSVNHVEVSDGIARSGRLPRSMFFVWRDPAGGRDLIIFLGEGQPTTRGDVLCQRILDFAAARGVERVVTFAALGTQLHPTQEPHAYGAVTSPDLLDELDRLGVRRIERGRISGLNGALLAAAADRSLPGLCLLGEFPFYAAGLANPRASRAVLEAFAQLLGVTVDVSGLERQAKALEPQALQLLEQIQEQAGTEGLLEELEPTDDDGPAEPDDEPSLDPTTREHIEELFDAASRDRGHADELKQELDRLGVFREYEDRFLDLFRKTR